MASHRKPIAFRGNYFEGKFVLPTNGSARRHVSPADVEDLLCEWSASVSAVDAVVESAHRAFFKWRKSSLADRIQKLKAYEAAVSARSEELASVLAREVGKPFWEAKTEVAAMVGKVPISVKEGLEVVSGIEIQEILPNTQGYCRYKPHGVMAVIGPFNFPGHLPNGHIVPALLCGNTVVFKPSEKAPLTAQIMAECFEKAGLPPGVFNVLHGEAEVSKALVAHQNIHGILFTGSYGVGTAIKRATLDQPWKILALEMGGKNTSIVWEDADLDRALFEIISGSFMTSGQRCSATSKIVLHEKIHSRFLNRFCQMTEKLKVGHPMENPFMGPLVDGAARKRYESTVDQAATEFKTEVGRKPIQCGYEGAYVSPTVFSAKSREQVSSGFAQSELFGPSVLIFTVKDLDEAIGIANESEFGLVSSVFTASEATYRHCWNELDTGLINWNKSTVGASSKLPFGGVKGSGNFAPTALFASRYCAVPISSLEMPGSVPVNPNVPGLTWI